MTRTVDGRFGSGRLVKATTFPQGRVTVDAVVDVVVGALMGDAVEAVEVVAGPAVDTVAADVDAADPAVVDIAVAVAGAGVKPRWAVRDLYFPFFDDNDDDDDESGLIGEILSPDDV